MRSEAVVREFQRLLEPGTVAGLTERQVLERFAERGDPVAFEAIVTRHGPMVYTVCRQMLRDPNDVDDAFQATFFILIKKAGTLRQPERLGPWLYGVAYRVAHRLRTRPTTSNLPENLAGPRLACPVEDNEQVVLLHEEIQRLPEKYRVPIVLCCIEGLSHDEAANRLGWPVGTVHGRLSRARERLRGRLIRRGAIISKAIPQAFLLDRPGQMILPDATRLGTLALVRGPVPASLDILTKGVLSVMITEKLKLTGIILFMTLVGLGTVTTALLAYQGRPAKPEAPTAKAAVQNDTRTKPRETKTDPTAKTGSDDPVVREDKERLAAEAKIEASHNSLDVFLADAALMQIELDITKNRIEKSIEFLTDRKSLFLEFDARLTPQDRREAEIRRANEQKLMYEQLDKYRGKYIDTWTKLARLKRQIVRQSRTLGVTPELAPTGTDLGRRLDGLEKKIDLIIDAMPANLQP
jgi:RNA polymerase sigma factor (sigma-70 family)